MMKKKIVKADSKKVLFGKKIKTQQFARQSGLKKKAVAGLAMLTLSSLSFLFSNAAMAETMKIPPKLETTNNKTLSASPALYPQHGIVISDRQESSNDTSVSPDTEKAPFCPLCILR